MAMRILSLFSSLDEILAIFFPSMVISPLSGIKIPIICFNRTLLPQPERPIITLVSPSAMFRLKPFKTLLELKFLYIFLISIIATTVTRRYLQVERYTETRNFFRASATLSIHHHSVPPWLRKDKIKYRGEYAVSGDYQNKAGYYRKGGSLAYTLGSAFSAHSLQTADHRDYHPKDQGFK